MPPFRIHCFGLSIFFSWTVKCPLFSHKGGNIGIFFWYREHSDHTTLLISKDVLYIYSNSLSNATLSNAVLESTLIPFSFKNI